VRCTSGGQLVRAFKASTGAPSAVRAVRRGLFEIVGTEAWTPSDEPGRTLLRAGVFVALAFCAEPGERVSTVLSGGRSGPADQGFAFAKCWPLLAPDG
jgi:hypothetical protein